ncbi:MAG: IclR family transcriptional regulator domain-containing protein, partial [Halobacteriota archaeon]
ATQSGRFLQGVHGVGAPIRDNHGTVYGAISLSGPAGRFTSERIDAELVPLVVGIAGELQINLSYS